MVRYELSHSCNPALIVLHSCQLNAVKGKIRSSKVHDAEFNALIIFVEGGFQVKELVFVSALEIAGADGQC
jgi:hypothetical protein